jgi:hypothetical protein
VSIVKRCVVAAAVVAASTIGLVGTASAADYAPLGAPGAELGSTVIDLAWIVHHLF